MRKIYITIITVLLCKLALSQSYQISGRLIGEDNKPIVSGNIIVYEKSNLLYNTGTISGIDGKFLISGIKNGDYTVKISHVGLFEREFDMKIYNQNQDVGKLLMVSKMNNLSEVEINAKTVESFADKKIYRLSIKDKQFADNSLEMMDIIPNLYLDSGNQSLVSMRGGSVKILLNGINASEADLLAIPSEQILRIEHFETPPPRYSLIGIGSVVNVITKDGVNFGGMATINLQNAVTTGFGNNLFSIKLNKKNAQFGLKYYLKYRDYSEREVDEILRYDFRNENYNLKKIGIESPFKYNNQLLEFNAINHKKNNYILSANLSLTSFSLLEKPNQNIIQYYPSKREKKSSRVIDDKYLKPVLDLYLNKKIGKNNEFYANSVITYFKTDYLNHYKEFVSDDKVSFNSALQIEGNKYSIISDMVFAHSFKNSKLEVGIRNMFAESNQDVLVNEGEVLSSNTNDIYGYLSANGKLKKISYSFSLGINNSKFNSRELAKNYSFFYLRPLIKMQYQITDKSEISLAYKLNTKNPSLGELTNNPVQLDSLFAYGGNSNLIPFKIHSNMLSYVYQSKLFYLNSDLTLNYAKDPIHPYFKNDSDFILQTYINYKYSREIKMELFAQWFPFHSKWLRLRIFGSYIRNEMATEFESWSYNGFRLIPSIIIQYKSSNIKIFYQSSQKSLNGQLLEKHPSAAYVEFDYRLNKQLSLLTGIRYPFYKAWSKSSSTYKTSIINRSIKESIIDNANMIYFRLRYNIPFGKQLKTSKKQLNNRDNDSGILK